MEVKTGHMPASRGAAPAREARRRLRAAVLAAAVGLTYLIYPAVLAGLAVAARVRSAVT